MMSTTLPVTVDHAVVERIVAAERARAAHGPVNLSPLFRYLTESSPDIAARCVREVADGLATAGVASVVPELFLRRGRVDAELEITKPERRRVLSTPSDRLPLLGFACFVAIIAGCMMLSGG